MLRFEVSDTGDGIAPDKLGLVFQPFVQADTSTSRKYGGTGLGLAISAQLVALMGGDCGVSSRLGLGSTFWFTISVTADVEQIGQRRPVPDPRIAGVTALIVDDNATQRLVLSEYLTDWGMVGRDRRLGPGRPRGACGAATREGRPFAVVLVDLSMPGMDGLELRDAIVAEPALETRSGADDRHGPASTSSARPQSPACVRFCPSRSIAANVLASLIVALDLKAVAETATASATAKRHPASNGARSGRLLLAEDNLINQKVAVAMLSGAGYDVDTVRNGAAAVQAAAEQAYDAILMDCQMPELNGYEATAAIRNSEGSGRRHTPIIAMTAGARREDRERCLAEGMDSYLAKPVSKEALLSTVARSMKSGKR